MPWSSRRHSVIEPVGRCWPPQQATLGAGYEFDPPRSADEPVGMIGGGLGPCQPGEWTDDTSMAIAIAEVAATGADLESEAALDAVVKRWPDWSGTAKDVGVQTRWVLSAAARRGISAHSALQESAALHRSSGCTAGNGSLMRTPPVALTYLDDEAGLVAASRKISQFTHYDPDAGDACVLWCTAIRHAVLTGQLDVRIGLGHLDAERRQLWAERLDEVEGTVPSAFSHNNGWVVAALQAAWSAIVATPVPNDDPAAGGFRVDHLRVALETAVRGGGDTDTVAAIAGGLLGAVYGASAVPSQWRLMLNGWPGLRARGLIQLADRVIDKGAQGGADVTYRGYQEAHPIVAHPHDDEVWIGGFAGLSKLPAEVDAVVSLGQVSDDDLPARVQHLDVRLIDSDGHDALADGGAVCEVRFRITISGRRCGGWRRSSDEGRECELARRQHGVALRYRKHEMASQYLRLPGAYAAGRPLRCRCGKHEPIDQFGVQGQCHQAGELRAQSVLSFVVLNRQVSTALPAGTIAHMPQYRPAYTDTFLRAPLQMGSMYGLSGKSHVLSWGQGKLCWRRDSQRVQTQSGTRASPSTGRADAVEVCMSEDSV